MISPNLAMAPSTIKLPMMNGSRSTPTIQIRPSMMDQSQSNQRDGMPSSPLSGDIPAPKSSHSGLKMTNFSIAAIMNDSQQEHSKEINNKIYNHSLGKFLISCSKKIRS